MTKKWCECFSLRAGTLTCGVLSLILSMSLVAATICTLFYDSGINNRVLSLFLVTGIVQLLASLSCLQGACTESRNYLLPWIFLAAVGIISMLVVSLSFVIYGYSNVVILGVILLAMAAVFSIGWVCVLSYYYQLCERSFTRSRSNNTQATTSTSSIVSEERLAPPPSYSVVFNNPVFEEKPPTYEEVAEKSPEVSLPHINSNATGRF